MCCCHSVYGKRTRLGNQSRRGEVEVIAGHITFLASGQSHFATPKRGSNHGHERTFRQRPVRTTAWAGPIIIKSRGVHVDGKELLTSCGAYRSRVGVDAAPRQRDRHNRQGQQSNMASWFHTYQVPWSLTHSLTQLTCRNKPGRNCFRHPRAIQSRRNTDRCWSAKTRRRPAPLHYNPPW